MTANANEVVMRFATLGGAPIDLYPVTYQTREHPRGYLMPDGETRTVRGFQWACRGCDTLGDGGRYGMGSHQGYEESTPDKSRREAQAHADSCRAMPKPGGESR